MNPVPDGEAGGSGPRPAGLLIAAVLVLAIAGGIYLAVSSGGDDEGGGAAHIATSSGSTNGLTPDERPGTPPAGTAMAGEGTRPGEATTLEAAATRAGCEVLEGLPDEGRDHLTRDDQVPDYGTDPPTSGPHIGPPLQQADGAYRDPAAPEDVVHSLEHGRIAIQYSPDLPEPGQLQIKGLYDAAYSKALLFPNPGMEFAVAASAWRNLIGCPRFRGEKTIEAIGAFGAAYQGKGPEDPGGFPALPGPDFSSLAGT